MRELTENTLHILIHELKDPLTIIKGTSEMHKDKSNYKKEIKEFGNIIQEQADYANYLLNNISTFNKLQDNIPIVLYNEETDHKQIEKVISKINYTNPDIVIFTGDLISNKYTLSHDEKEFLIEKLSDIKASINKIATSTIFEQSSNDDISFGHSINVNL